MRSRRIILGVLALAVIVARLALGLPAAFPVLGLVAIVAIPLCLAFMVADAIPWRRDPFVASAVGLVGLPLALLIPVWGWIAAVVVIAAQVIALRPLTPTGRAPRS